jgi:hypothetical protein
MISDFRSQISESSGAAVGGAAGIVADGTAAGKTRAAETADSAAAGKTRAAETADSAAGKTRAAETADSAAAGKTRAAETADSAAAGKTRAAERERVEVGEIELFEPATRAEAEALWERLEHDPKEQNEWFGVTREGFCDAMTKRRRTIAVYHRGELLGIARVEDLPDGNRYLAFTRTEAAVGKGHKLTWAKSVGKCIRHVADTERARGRDGRLFAIIPSKYIRAIWFYTCDAPCRVVGETSLKGHGITVMEVAEEEDE